MRASIIYYLITYTLKTIIVYNIDRSRVAAMDSPSATDEQSTSHGRIMMSKMMGGYAPVPNVHAKRVQEIALYVLETLITMTTTKDDKYIYSFQSQFMADRSTSAPHEEQSQFQSLPSTSWDAIVVAGNQQVVAGMNYQLKIVITSHKKSDDIQSRNDCRILGAFDVIVYDQFGALSVTRWGSEISVQEAMELLKNCNSNDDTTKDDTTDVNAILDSEGKL
jgi:hypothetical protein